MTNPQAVEALSDDNIEWPDVESMSHSAVQEALSYGLGYDVIHRHMLSVMFKTAGACRAALATQPAPQPEAQASPAPAPLSEDRIIAAWNAQRKYHGGEPCKLGHLEFARAVESMVRGIGLDGGV